MVSNTGRLKGMAALLIALVLAFPVAAALPDQAQARSTSNVPLTTQVAQALHAANAKLAAKKRVTIKKATAYASKKRVYTGKNIKLAVKLVYNGKKLKAGRDYELLYQSNVNVGTAKAIVRGKGRYKGAKVIRFQIVKANIAKAKVAKIASLYTSGLSAAEPEPVVKYKGMTLEVGRDYTVSYQDNIMPGKAIVNIEGKGSFEGTTAKSFKLVNMGDALARKACELSYSQERLKKKGYLGTSAYLAAYSAYKAKGCGPPASCSVGMHIAIRAAGYDWNFKVNTQQDCNYLNYWSGAPGNYKWTCMGDYWNGMELLPGDILLGDKRKGVNHVFMYVGSDIAREVYESTLAGTDADVGYPYGEWVSALAHYRGGAALCICGYKFSANSKQRYKVFRCTNPDCLSEAG